MQLKILLYSIILLCTACKQTDETPQDSDLQITQSSQQITLNKTWQYHRTTLEKNQYVETWAVYDQAATYAQPSAQLVIRRDQTGVMRVQIVVENTRFHCDRNYCPINVSFAGKTFVFYVDAALSTAIEQSTIVLSLNEVDAFLVQLRQVGLIEISTNALSADLPKLIFNTQLSSDLKSY